MNVANESSPAPSLRRVPFSIRFAPEFVNTLSAILPADDDESDRFDGLLFGIVETDFAVLRMFRLFPSTGTQESFETLLSQAKKEPQVAGLGLVGWFSARNAIDLEPEDIAFHEKNFARPNQIALMVKSEPASQMSLEVYCRTSDGAFSEQKHRGGGIRISHASPVVAPFELPLKTKVYPDVLFADRQSEDVLEQQESAAGWKDAFASKTTRAFEALKTVKPEEKGESTASIPASEEEVEVIQPDDPSSISPGPQFGTSFGGYGGAAPAPARIPQPKPEAPAPVEHVREEALPAPDAPPIVDVPKRPPPAPPVRQPVLVRSEEPRAASSANERLANALHWPRNSEPSNTEPDPAPPATPSVTAASLRQLSPFKPKTFRDLPWAGLAALFILAAAATFGFIYIKTAHANGRLPGFLQALLPPPTLNMKIATVGDRFQLSWNRDNPVVRNAREAILDINDGTRHHQIQLGSAEVANGSVLYLPNTDDVIFRLEVHGAGGQNASESLRIVGTSTSSVAGVSRATDTPAAGTPAGRAQTAGKKATGSPRVSAPPRSEKPPQQEVVAANRVPATRKNIPASAKPGTYAPPMSAPPPAKPEVSTNSGALAGSAPGNPNGMKTTTETPQVTVPPARDTAVSSPATTALTPPAEQPRVVEAPSPQAGGGVPAPAGSPNSAPGQIPQAQGTQPTQAAPAGAKPLLTYRPPRPSKQVLPKLSALPAGIAAEAVGQLKIVVRVDESGHVVDARLIEGEKKVSSILANASLAAAKQWEFEPASLHGKNVASDHTILFQFRH